MSPLCAEIDCYDPASRTWQVHLREELLLASASKFPAACAIAGAVANGYLTFETKVSKVFAWWTNDPSDRRSRVTLRHLLSFTSGFYWVDASGEVSGSDP